MTPSARLQAVIDLLDSIESVLRPADALVSGYFRAHRYIGSKDRAAISSTVYDSLRHHARLDWWIQKLGETPTVRLRLLTYETLVAKKDLRTVSDLFNGGKFGPASLSDEERMVLKRLQNHTIAHPDMPDDVVGECPPWAYAGLKKRFGKRFIKEMQALLTSAPLDLRVNTIKTNRETALAAIKKQGFSIEVCPYSPLALRLRERPDLNRLPLLRDGSIEIQDEGSQLVALLMGAKPGERVVDFCAGAGGKTLALAAQMENKGRITACDILEGRLKRSLARFKKAGFHNIEIKPLSTERDPWVKRHKGTFDRVLVDAPCSGTGTWRRNPDSRWRLMGPGIDQLYETQASILDSAARLVKAGGRLVYATCSLLPEENEEQIEKFLAFHPDFAVLPLAEAAPEIKTLPPSEDFLKLTPAQHNTDGFFAAVLQRAPAPDEGPPA